jgi:hypothetical protein
MATGHIRSFSGKRSRGDFLTIHRAAILPRLDMKTNCKEKQFSAGCVSGVHRKSIHMTPPSPWLGVVKQSEHPGPPGTGSSSSTAAVPTLTSRYPEPGLVLVPRFQGLNNPSVTFPIGDFQLARFSYHPPS